MGRAMQLGPQLGLYRARTMGRAMQVGPQLGLYRARTMGRAMQLGLGQWVEQCN